MLPFLYSANPYFELLRSNSLPSLVQFDFRLAIFDSSGRLVFNPGKLSSGLPPGLLESKDLDGPGMRADFRDKNERFDLFAFRSDGRVYAVLTPRPGVIGRAVGVFQIDFPGRIAVGPDRPRGGLGGRPTHAPPPPVVVCRPGLRVLCRRRSHSPPSVCRLLPGIFQPRVHPAIRPESRDPRQPRPQRHGRSRRPSGRGESARSRRLPTTSFFGFLQPSPMTSIFTGTDDWPRPAAGSCSTTAFCPSSSTARSIIRFSSPTTPIMPRRAAWARFPSGR